METSDDIPLGRLLANIGRLQASRMDSFVGQLGLYRGQAMLLLILSRQEGLTHSEIAEELQISPAAASKVIQRMEKMGFLQRRPDPADERVSRVFLQEAGQSMTHQIKASFQKINRIITGDFSSQEQDQLKAYLLRVYQHLQAPPDDSI